MSSDPKQQAMETQAAEAEYEDQEYEEEYEEVSGGRSRFMLFLAMPAWLISMVIHGVLLLLLAVLTFGPEVERLTNVLTVAPPAPEVEEIEEFEEIIVDPIDVTVTEMVDTTQPVEVVTESIPEEVTEVAVATDVDSAAIAVELSDFGETTAPKNDLLQEIGSLTGSGLDGRGTAAARKAAVAKYGGNQASEDAVALALQWIAKHQDTRDGGWNFDHRIGPGVRLSDHPGNLTTARNGATAMAVLPFLGSGQTHVEGSYKPTVKAGLYYLMTHMKNDGSMFEGGGSMYSHGLGAITLCEAYAMTHDKALMAPAQASINFIVYAQDPVGGGWRYQPKQPGDTSVVGWQLMALKSGHMAYLAVPPQTVKGCIRFLDGVQADSGSGYGYTTPGRGQATTAVGLLCRMYLGWKKDNGALQRGVEYLSKTGPSKTNMYYNYYATQVMRQYGGEPWEKWNNFMRDYLVSTQEKQGPAAGSWYFNGGHGAERGGRLYNTSLATMILEVYYRHMPIYQTQATTEEFPL